MLFFLPLVCSHYPLLAGIEKELASRYQEVPATKIHSHLVHALISVARDEFDLPRIDLICVRDYSGCPQNWVDLGNGKCAVPLAYEGSCTEVTFGGKTPTEKSKLAMECNSRFPCLNRGRSAYSASCPEDWTYIGDGKCSAPTSYAGPCVLQYDFGHLDERGKQKFEEMCEVFWPARAAPSTSFMQFPEIGAKFRNGIFASGPMRSPPRALINIVESENVQHLQQRGGNIAKEKKIQDYKEIFNARIGQLESGRISDIRKLD